MDTVIVDRSKWCRGKIGLGSTGLSLLTTDKNTHCCLGFALNQLCGVPMERMLDIPYPSAFYSLIDKENFSKFVTDGENSEITDSLMGINDDQVIDDTKREENLNKEAKKIGIEFKFIN